MTAEQERALFYHELGRALSQWAYVELDLRHLITACVPIEARRFVAVGYFSIENFRSKLAYCDSIVVESKHATTTVLRWQPLADRIRTASSRRNRLAHWTMMMYPRGKTGRRCALVEWAPNEFSAPSKQELDKNPSGPPSSAICLRQVLEARYEFESLTPALANLRAAFLGEPESWPEDNSVPAIPKSPEMHWKTFALKMH